MQITEHNAITNETIVRDMTDAEIKQYEKDQLVNEEIANKIAVEKAKRDEILGRLGLTADEAKLLIG